MLLPGLICGIGYCERPAVAYVVRTHGQSRRLIAILGPRAAFLGERSPVELRCYDCLHDELDVALGRDT